MQGSNPNDMPKAKRSPAAPVKKTYGIHSDAQKAEVKRARRVIARHKAVFGGGSVCAEQSMTLTTVARSR